jgi:tRNA-dihydrouridine synthase
MLMKIGRLSLKNNVFLAPMAGITDLPFRTIVRGSGCGLAFTEMISASGLLRGQGTTGRLGFSFSGAILRRWAKRRGSRRTGGPTCWI